MSEEVQEKGGVSPFAPITGFVNYTPIEQYQFNLWLKKTAEAFERFGFTPLHLRPFERLSALQGEGETQKQIFEVFRADTGQTTGLGIPFDHTVPLALWVSEHAGHLQHLPLPCKRYDMGLSFRGERPKAGRFRAFVQADVDIVGRKLGLSADAECLSTILSALSSIEVGPLQVKINHIGVVKSLLRLHSVPEEHHAAVLRAIDKLDKLSVKQVQEEIAKIPGLSPSQIEQLLERFTAPAALSDKDLYGEGAIAALEDLKRFFDLMQVDLEQFVFSPSMVRGLAYYTGIVFEITLVGKESFGSIASGGRYSNLVGDFTPHLSDVEGVGGSIGLTRLFDALSEEITTSRKSCAQILVGARTEEFVPLASELSLALRAKGLKVDLYAGSPKIKHILGHASQIGVPYAALVMDTNAIVVKNMATQEQQEYADISQAASAPFEV